MKQHILIVCQYFYPEEFRINDIAKEWVKKGYKVTVVTGIPNYPKGKFFDGYGWFRKRDEDYEGVRVIRLPIIPRGNNSIMLMLNYLSYVVSGFLWKSFTKVEADKVFVFQLSPVSQALIGVWYAKRMKIPCYMYVQDLWPENLIAVTGINNDMIIGMVNKMVNYIYRNCQKIFATSPSFVKRIEERESAWDNEKSKVIYWPQYAEALYKPADRNNLEDMSENNKFKIVFTGNIGYSQGLDILPRTAVLLKEASVDCEFIIIGDGRYKSILEKEIEQSDVSEMFHLLGRKKPEEIPAYLAWCDVAFISFANSELFEMTIPAKLQSYMACGMPIIAAARGETERVIVESGCGCCCDLANAEQLKAKIVELANMDANEMSNMKKAALEYSHTHFEKDVLLSEMDGYLESEMK